MKKLAATTVLLFAAVVTTGCARPNEIGWGVAYSADERGKMIARNWDYEGKQIVDDIDHILMLRPMGHLTMWNLR
jgi:hypothetical protein